VPRALLAPERARIKTEEALAWYDRHIAEDPGIVEIARAVLISPAHLRRLFQRAHGQSPHVLLNRRRMQRVEALLRDTRHSPSISRRRHPVDFVLKRL